GLLTAFGVGFTPHVQRQARTDLRLRAYPVDLLLHLAIAPVTTFHCIGRGQIPPDLVVKCQDIDNVKVIFSRIWRRNIVQTLYRNRKGRCELRSPSEAHWSTTKSGGMCTWTYD